MTATVPDLSENMIWLHLGFRMLEREKKENGRSSSDMPLIFDGLPAIVWSSSTLPFLWHSRTSAAPNSNVWSSITSQIQSVCEIALSNQASRSASLCRRSSVFSLVKSRFRMSFKNQFHSSVQNEFPPAAKINKSIRKQTKKYSWWLLLRR